jgi:hypothetical protein
LEEYGLRYREILIGACNFGLRSRNLDRGKAAQFDTLLVLLK